MMENYEQTVRLATDRIKQIDEEHPIKLQETNEFFSRVEFAAANKHTFNFGANILNTKTMSSPLTPATNNVGGEEKTKTNNIKIETKITIPATAKADLAVSIIADTAVSVDDPLQFEAIADEEIKINMVAVGAEEEEHDEDSYGTDCNDHSQQSHDSTNLLQTPTEHEDDDEDNPIDESDDSTSDSDFSDLSGLSDMSGRDWKPINQRPLNWVQKQIHSGANPREILSKFLPPSAQRISPELTDMTLWRILASMLSEPPRRKKLSYINTFDDVINLLHKSKNIIILTGAGVSVSCGIPDFRSSDGIYSRLAKDFPDLPDPQAMFDINYFSRDPRPFFKFAREIYPGQFKPSPCHRFIKVLEQKQKLLRNYTQNIDTLEQVAGIRNVIECHGSFSTASCTKCKYKCDADSIRSDIFAQRIPVCPRCQPNVQQSVDASEPVSEFELRRLVENGIMKPDIVFFGEGLPDEFHTVMASDKDKCDLLIVMGSSLKVRPVALIPSSIPNHVPQILINREQLHHLDFDVELLGDGDVVINQICHRLGEDWKDICFNNEILTESKELMALKEEELLDDEDTAKEVPTYIEALSSHSSPDLVLQSTNITYSDSGFESLSTSSTTKKDAEFLPPDYLDEPMEATATFGGSCDYRHLSIDSSKDSGILGDASNSALPPAFNNFADTTDLKKKCLNIPASTSQSLSNKPAGVDNLNSTKAVDNNSSEADKQSIRRQLKHESAAERLYKGTYYSHENTASYVFPGAQVYWCSETDEEEDDLEERRQINDDDDTNHAPLSPLMTPSVENEMVKAIASNNTTHTQQASTSNTFTNVMSSNSSLSTLNSRLPQQTQNKRHWTDPPLDSTTGPYTELSASEAINDKAISCYNTPPPHKKRRDSSEHKTSVGSSLNISLESS